MNRREAVQHIALLLGGTIVGANAFLTGCTTSGKKKTFSEADVAYLNEIADTILPTTNTPGAKAANVGQFMTVMVNDCYDAENQKTFFEGMDKLNDLSKKDNGNTFINASPQQRHDLLVKLDHEQKQYTLQKKPADASHYFRLMKELTLLGYFTSEIGCTQARRYEPVPGRYDGCVPYKKGEKAWA